MEASPAEAATSSRGGPRGRPTWQFIGPQPMLNALPNFGGPIPGATFNATGRISALAADPSTPGRLFVGAANGGVWMSTDGGSTFTPIGDALPTQAIGALALDAVHTSPPTLYVATGEANNAIDTYYGQGLFQSRDLGATWLPLAPGTFDQAAFSSLAIDTSQNPPILFAAVSFAFSSGRGRPAFVVSDRMQNGLWKSTDGGNSWMHYPAATFRCVLLPTPSTTPCPAEDVRLDPQNPSDVYVAIRFNNVFISHDGGTTFTAACFTNDTPCSFPSALNQLDRASLAVGPPTPGAPLACSGGTQPCGTLYAMLGAPNRSTYVGFFTSSDGGATWVAATVPSWPNPNGTTIDGTTPGNFSQEFYDQALLVSPTDPATVLFGGVGLYASTDAGASWTFLAQNGGIHSDQHALALDADQDTVYVGNDGGVFKFRLSESSGGMVTFTALNETLGVGQMQGIGPHPTSDTTVLAGFQDNGTDLYSGDLAWTQPETGDGGFTFFDHSDPRFAYHTFNAGGTGTTVRLGESSDGGATWVHFLFSDPLGFSFYPPLAGDPAVAQRVLLGGHVVLVLNFAAGTVTVTRHSPQDLTGGCTSGDCALQDLAFAPSDHTLAWALSKQSGATAFKLFTTTQADRNSGATWTDVTGNLPFDSASTQATGIALDPHDTNTAYLSISGFTAMTGVGHIFQTTDFGTTWTQADGTGGSAPLPDVPVLRVLVDRRDAREPTRQTLYAATDVGVFRSTDGGATWSAFNLDVLPAVPVFDMAQNENGVIFIGTHGRGAYQLLQPRPQGPDVAVSSLR